MHFYILNIKHDRCFSIDLSAKVQVTADNDHYLGYSWAEGHNCCIVNCLEHVPIPSNEIQPKQEILQLEPVLADSKYQNVCFFMFVIF